MELALASHPHVFSLFGLAGLGVPLGLQHVRPHKKGGLSASHARQALGPSGANEEG